MVALLGVPLLLTINAAAFLLSALSEMFIHIPQIAAQGVAKATNFWQDLREGFNYARQNRVLIEIMSVAAVLNLVWAPTFILLPKFVQEHLGASSEPVSYTHLPLMAMLSGWILLSEQVTALQMGGAALIIFGLYIARNGNKKSK